MSTTGIGVPYGRLDSGGLFFRFTPVGTRPPAASLRGLNPARLARLALVALGGLLGAAARQAIEEARPTHPGTFPVATFVINVAGAFLLGLLLESLARTGPDTGWWRVARLTLGPGFLGAFTTYSTLAIESDLLVRGNHPGTAAGYMAASVLAGLAAAYAGMALGIRVGRIANSDGPP